MDHGIQTGIAGVTVTSIGAFALQFPPLATTNALKLWGAAAGVASTLNVELITFEGPGLTHSGSIEVMNPDVGKPSVEKQTNP
jgi:hypothetical protein